jgi:hypothetical protein
MFHRIPKILTDSIGQPYMALEFMPYEIQPYLDFLKKQEALFDEMSDKVKQRDGYNYHMTVLNASEYSKFKNKIQHYNYPFDVEFLGIGETILKDSKIYYIVAHCKDADNYREKYYLSPKDFHVTLAFNHKDIFGVDKSIVKWKI